MIMMMTVAWQVWMGTGRGVVVMSTGGERETFDYLAGPMWQQGTDDLSVNGESLGAVYRYARGIM
jgi:hypothetical protein